MRRLHRSCHRVMAALTVQEIRQLHEIVDAIAQHPESDRPATVSEAIRWAVSELHGALAARGVIGPYQPGTAVITEIVDVQEPLLE
jgi:hypothetical protein